MCGDGVYLLTIALKVSSACRAGRNAELRFFDHAQIAGTKLQDRL